jgi:integrase
MLTDNEIRKFDSPKNWPPKRLLLTDRGGLALDVLPSGVRSWVFRYRDKSGVRCKLTIARYPDLSLRAAREERDKLAGEVARGLSPVHEQKAQKRELKEREEGRGSDPTLAQFADRWYRELVLPPKGRNHRRNPKPVRGALDNQILPALGGKLLKEITKADLRKFLFEKRNAGHETAALFLRQIIKSVLDYAVVEELLEFNPVTLIPKDAVGTIENRERDLSDEEVREMLKTVEASTMARPIKTAVRLLLLTMVRKGELLRAQWPHLDFDKAEWHIPREHSKTGRPHIVPLAPQAVTLFRELEVLACGSPYVLASRFHIRKPMCLDTPNKALAELTFAMPHFTVHDLRRTAATRCAEGGFPGDVVELALNHARQGIRGVYNRSELLEQRREMLKWWANRVDALTNRIKLVELKDIAS